MFGRILAANDGSVRAFKALSAACDFAKRFNAELHMIVVEELPRFPASVDEITEEIKEADHQLEAMVSRANTLVGMQNLKLHAHVVPGHPVPTIVEFIRERGFDLLVIGFMGHSAIYERIIGGTADRLVRLAPCTVVVVK